MADSICHNCGVGGMYGRDDSRGGDAMTGAIDIEAARKLAEEAKARAEAATPGEWQVATGDEAPGTAYRVIGLLSSEIAFICSTYGVQPVDLTDATFIAAARADVPALADMVLALLAELEHAEADNARLRTVMRERQIR